MQKWGEYSVFQHIYSKRPDYTVILLIGFRLVYSFEIYFFDFCFLRCGDSTIVALLIDGLPYTVVFVAADYGFVMLVIFVRLTCICLFLMLWNFTRV